MAEFKINLKSVTAAFLICGCTNGVPTSKLPSISGLSVTPLSVSLSSLSQGINVIGNCDNRYSDVQISLDLGTTWKSIKSVSPLAANCSSSQSFGGLLTLSTQNVASALVSSGQPQIYKILFRGVTMLGNSNPTTMNVTVQPTLNMNPGVGTGQTPSSTLFNVSGNVKVVGSVRNFALPLNQKHQAP